jgi:hypothetical protein
MEGLYAADYVVDDHMTNEDSGRKHFYNIAWIRFEPYQ